jgi:cytochrome c oxidase subunit I
MRVQGATRFILLSEIVFPFVLLILGVLLGLFQVLARAGILRTDGILGIEYYQGLTLHGTINAIVFTTFFIVGFSNALMMHQLGRPLRLPVQWLSWLLMVVGTLMAAFAMLTGRATVLYTFYPPLTAHWSFYVGVVLLVVGSLLPFFLDWTPSVLAWRRENPTARLPLAVMGVMVTFFLWFVMIIPVAIEILFFLLPVSLGWRETFNPLLTRTLFWFFGHPLVYFWLLPSYIMLYTMLPRLVGWQALFGCRGAPGVPAVSPLLGACGVASPVHRGRSDRWLEAVARFPDLYGGVAEFHHGVHRGGFDGVWRSAAGRAGVVWLVDEAPLLQSGGRPLAVRLLH